MMLRRMGRAHRLCAGPSGKCIGLRGTLIEEMVGVRRDDGRVAIGWNGRGGGLRAQRYACRADVIHAGVAMLEHVTRADLAMTEIAEEHSRGAARRSNGGASRARATERSRRHGPRAGRPGVRGGGAALTEERGANASIPRSRSRRRVLRRAWAWSVRGGFFNIVEAEPHPTVGTAPRPPFDRAEDSTRRRGVPRRGVAVRPSAHEALRVSVVSLRGDRHGSVPQNDGDPPRDNVTRRSLGGEP